MDEGDLASWLLVSNGLLLAVTVGMGVMVLSLARQVRMLHQRTAALGLARRAPPVRVGERLPPLVAENLRGDDVDLDVIAAGGSHVALLFVAAACPICRTVAPLFRQRVASAGVELAGYLVGSDGAGVLRDDGVAAGFDPDHCLVGGLLALQLRVRLLPFLVVMDPQGRLVARELIQGARALDRTLSAVAGVVPS
jgi:methylamine dehydrogenase accessory protein MauD